MAGLPSTPNLVNPNVPIQTDYRQKYSEIGSRVANVASEAGSLYDKVNAYKQLKEMKKDETKYRDRVLFEVLDLMGESYPPEAKEKTKYLIQNGDLDEIEQKATLFKRNIEFAKENSVGVLPQFGERDFVSKYEPVVKERKSKETAEKEISAAKGKRYSEGTVAAAEAGGYGPLQDVTKDVLGAQAKTEAQEIAEKKAQAQMKTAGASMIRAETAQETKSEISNEKAFMDIRKETNDLIAQTVLGVFYEPGEDEAKDATIRRNLITLSLLAKGMKVQKASMEAERIDNALDPSKKADILDYLKNKETVESSKGIFDKIGKMFSGITKSGETTREGPIQDQTMPTNQPTQTTEKFTVGKVYRNSKGQEAKYLGNGKWGKP